MSQGWPTKSLGDVCRLISGQHIDAKDYNLHMKGIGYLTGPSDFGALHPVVSKWTEHPKITAERGDILLTVKGSGIGKVNVLSDDKVAISRQLMAIRVTGADPGFVYAFLSFAGEHFQSLSTGAAIPGISREQVLSLTIPAPPLPEQQRIVTLLDEAFAGLAIAKANAERNLQNAHATFESKLESIFSQRGEGWTEKRLEEVGNTQTGTTPKTSEADNYGDFIPFIKPSDFNPDGSLNYGNQGLTETGLANSRVVRSGSVLMVCIGATIGKCGYCEVDVATNQQINALSPSDGSLHRFIYYQMRSRPFQRSVIEGAGQATLPIINKSKWSALPIWLPSNVAEQEYIAASLDALSAETQHLAHLYKRKLAALEELKKSLLQQAFNGEL